MLLVVITVVMALIEHKFSTLAKYNPGLTIDINMNVGSENENEQNESSKLYEEEELQRAIGRDLYLGSIG